MRSPWIARCRLSSPRRLDRKVCPMKKVARPVRGGALGFQRRREPCVFDQLPRQLFLKQRVKSRTGIRWAACAFLHFGPSRFEISNGLGFEPLTLVGLGFALDAGLKWLAALETRAGVEVCAVGTTVKRRVTGWAFRTLGDIGILDLGSASGAFERCLSRDADAATSRSFTVVPWPALRLARPL